MTNAWALTEAYVQITRDRQANALRCEASVATDDEGWQYLSEAGEKDALALFYRLIYVRCRQLGFGTGELKRQIRAAERENVELIHGA